MFDRFVTILAVLFYFLLALDIMPVTLTSVFNRLIEPELVSFHLLGFVGVLFILSFVVYALRKHNVIRAGSSIVYLKTHILLALTGSGLALAHSTLKLSAFNTRILVSALVLIVTSGIIGRYLFARVNNLKNGMELNLKDLEREFDEFRQKAASALTPEEMRIFEAKLLPGPAGEKTGFVKGLLTLFERELDSRTPRIAESGLTIGHDEMKRFRSVVRKGLKLDNAVKMLGLAKSLFSRWKKVHVPFTVILLLTLFVHILTQYLFGNVRLFHG